MRYGTIKKLGIVAFICATIAPVHHNVHADNLVLNNIEKRAYFRIDKTAYPYLANPTLSRIYPKPELNISLEIKNKRKNYFKINYLPPEFSNNRPRKVSFGTVFSLALKEFDFLSGIKKVVDITKVKFENYKEDFYLTGQVTFHKEQKARSIDFIQKYKLEKIRWNFDINPTEKEVSCRLKIGEYVTFAGDFGKGTEFRALVGFNF